ncbi:hypothetical protein SD457_20985 [Coprobacillaceae bacterium CR2/5/TPMF4]|nr:hypothetical protein SD457_20985 [Coprobacillaceae bacterium CR2/5/TPMF4]
MYISLLMNIINIVGNYIGVIILQAGVAGVAFPTLISRIVAAIIMLVLSFNHENPIYIKTKEVFAFNTTMIKKYYKSLYLTVLKMVFYTRKSFSNKYCCSLWNKSDCCQ